MPTRTRTSKSKTRTMRIRRHATYAPPRRRQHPRVAKCEGVLYYGLFFAVSLSLFFLFTHIFGNSTRVWHVYYGAYLIGSLAYMWYVFGLLFWGDVRKRRHRAYNGARMLVIIPCYNESAALLRKTVESVVRAKGNKEIVIVDDGSTNGTHAVLRSLAEKHGITIHMFERNYGKRYALHCALKYMADCEYVVTVDSDTILDPDALIRLVEPLQSNNVGATTGDVRLLNEEKNWLTRMTGAYYWVALHIHRNAQSTLGMVSCCSGALSAYRTSVLKTVMTAFVNQEFFGKKCTHSEDRHLANLVLKSGRDTLFVADAVAYTHSPETVRGFMQQQLRWRRGFIMESIFALTFMWRVKPALFVEIFLWELVLPLMSSGIVLLVLMHMILQPTFFLFTVLPQLAILMVVRHMPALFYARDKVPGLFVFTLFGQFVMYWQGLYALCTLRNRGWITR